MHQLELLVQQFKAHLAAESGRIERLKDFSAALEIHETSNGSHVSLTGCDDSNGTRYIDGKRQAISVVQEIRIEEPPEIVNRDLWSTLGQYQIKRDEFIKERKQEYQEYLKQQQDVLAYRQDDLKSCERELVIRSCKDRNEFDEERRKIEDHKYREELKKQIEENKIRRAKEKEYEIRRERQDEIRFRREMEKIDQNVTKKEDIRTIKDVEEITTVKKMEDRMRSPSYLHVREPRKVSTPIKLRPLLEAFSRSTCSDTSVFQDKNTGVLPMSPGMASLSQVRKKMLQDHKELVNKLQSDLSIT